MSTKTTGQTEEIRDAQHTNAGWATLRSIVAILVFASCAFWAWKSKWESKNMKDAVVTMCIIATTISLIPFSIYLSEYRKNKKSN